MVHKEHLSKIIDMVKVVWRTSHERENNMGE
jgi:hypothetical protein